MPTATFEGFAFCGHKKTSRPEEYVGVTINTDASSFITGYTSSDAQPGHHPGEAMFELVNPATGATEQPAGTYTLHTVSLLSDIFLETPYTFDNPDNNDQQMLWGSLRGMSTTRWRSIYPEHGYDVEWLCRDGVFGLGVGISSSEFLHEWDGVETDPLPYVAIQNPTHGGAQHLPVPTPPHALADLKGAPTSPPLYLEADSSGITGAAIPLEFEDDTPHATVDGSRLALHWRQKRVERAEPFYRGERYVSCVTYWHYQPRGWDTEDFGGDPDPPLSPVRLRCSHNGHLFSLNQGLGFDKMWVADITVASDLTEIVEYSDGTITTSGRWQFFKANTKYLNDLSGIPTGPSYFTNGYGLVLFHRPSDDFCVGGIARMGDGWGQIGKLQQNTITNNYNVTRRQGTGLTNNQVTGVSVPDTVHGHEVTLTMNSTSYIGRDSGWIGSNLFIFTGPISEALATAKRLVANGWVDEAPDFGIIPGTVLEGTVAPNPNVFGGSKTSGAKQSARKPSQSPQHFQTQARQRVEGGQKLVPKRGQTAPGQRRPGGPGYGGGRVPGFKR